MKLSVTANNITTNVDKFKTFKDIKSFEDVLLYLGKDITKKYGKFKKIRLIYKAFQKITNFVPNYSNSNQNKYYPYFRYDSAASRFVFGVSHCVTMFTCSDSGVRFCLPSEKISNYIGKQFINEFNDILL